MPSMMRAPRRCLDRGPRWVVAVTIGGRLLHGQQRRCTLAERQPCTSWELTPRPRAGVTWEVSGGAVRRAFRTFPPASLAGAAGPSGYVYAP
jgi:hypothetical protein